MVEKRGLVPDEMSFSTMIHACGKAGEWRRALGLLHAMEAKLSINAARGRERGREKGEEEEEEDEGVWVVGGSDMAVAAAVDACTRSGQLDEGLKLCEEMLLHRNTNAAGGREGGREGGRYVCSPVIHSTMITLACRAGDLPRALALLEELRARGAHPDVVTYTTAVKALGRAGQTKEALSLFTAMREDPHLELNDVSYHTALDVCARGARAIPECAVTAVELLRGMQQDGLRPGVLGYRSGLQACGLAGRWEDAMMLLREMEGKGGREGEGDEVAYTTVINACAAADEVDAALRLLEEMTDKGLTPNVVAYFAVVRACKRTGRWEQALVLLDDMQARGIPPVSAIFEFAADACVAARQLTHASSLLRLMRERGLDPPEGIYVRAISLALEQQQQQQQQRQQGGEQEGEGGKEALRLLCEMVRHGATPRRPLYTAVMQAAAAAAAAMGGGGREGGKEGGWGGVFAALGQTASALLGETMEERGGREGGREKVRGVRKGLETVREMALVAAAAAGDWRRALLLLREKEASGGDGGGGGWREGRRESGRDGVMDIWGHYACAVEACGRAGRVQEAVALLEGQSHGHGRGGRREGGRGGERVLSQVIEALGGTGHGIEALEMAKCALRGAVVAPSSGSSSSSSSSSSSTTTTNSDADSSIGSSSLSALRSERLRKKQMERRRHLQQHHQQHRQDHHRLSEDEGDYPVSWFPFSQPHRRLPGHQRHQQQISRSAWQTLLRVAKAQVQEEREGEKGGGSGRQLTKNGRENLLWVLGAMFDAGIPPSNGDVDWVVQTLATAREWDALHKVLEKVAMAASFSRGGVGDEGNGSRGRGSLDVIGCNRLLHALAREGEGKRALDFLSFMEDRLGVPPDVVSYTSVIDALAKSGEWQEAVRLLETMEERESTKEGWEGGGVALRPNVRTYTVAMQACAKAGKWQQCLALMDRLMEKGMKPDAFSCSIALDACARAKQPEAALTLLEKMEEGGLAVRPDVVSYTNVIRAFEGGGSENAHVERAKAVRDLLKRVKAWGVRPDIMLWNSALRVSVKLGQWQLTQEILKEMDRDSIVPDEWTVRAVTSGGRVEGSAGRERGQTLALLRTMQDRNKGQRMPLRGGRNMPRMRGSV